MADRVFAATRKGLFEFRRRGRGDWQVASTAFMGSPVSMLLSDPRDGALYASLDLGHFGVKLHRSDDDGANWTEIAAPSYAGVDADVASPPSLKLIWALETGGPEEDGVLWAGTIPGGLFRSSDRGRSWSFVRSLWDDPRRKAWMGGGFDEPGIHSISVDPRDPRRVAIAVSCGGVWETTDAGETWRLGGAGMRAEYLPPEEAGEPETQDAHRMVRCAAAPDSFWVQHHNGVFLANEGVGQWSEIHPSTHSAFGFAVAVHPRDPRTAWFAPSVKDEFRYPADGRVVVARTRDGGQTFDVLTEGLPQEQAYDLVYRHGMDIDDTGEVLAIGSTTGGLWLTEDGGDTWSAARARLPPVYAVRFG
ncbi:MAG: hypothetical protein JO111_09225 [Caulobacteraceae bacterium]|nr:hypothetical protein [Caulobacteraceae bacterium]